MASFQSMLAGLAKPLVLSQLQNIKHGAFTVQDENETTSVMITSSGTTSSVSVKLVIKSSKAWIRIVHGYDIGFAEAFMLGELSCSNLTDFFRILQSLEPSRSGITAEWLYSIANVATAPFHRLSNTSSQALVNARNHYSLSNEVFAAFLDPTMTYSAPLWLPKSHPGSSSDSLESAQVRKLRYVISAARIQANDHVLEIGTGWGSFAIEAVRQTGCRVTTVTASSTQAVLAKERIEAAGFGHHIDVIVCDYRQIPMPKSGNRYDRVVSIEMIEHVGYEYLETYFACIDRYLKLDGGIVVFQCITIPEARYSGYRRRQDFIQRYIFPGGHLPTVSHLTARVNTGSRGRLVVEDVKSVSGHYVRTLREWRDNFTRNWPTQIQPALRKCLPKMTEVDMDVFLRKWEYYFCYCEAGFAMKRLGDVCITAGREGTLTLIDDIPF